MCCQTNKSLNMTIMMKLTKVQERAKAKLSTEWLSAYELQESIKTLESLVRSGEAVQKREGLSSMLPPRAILSYKLKVPNVELRGDASRRPSSTQG